MPAPKDKKTGRRVIRKRPAVIVRPADAELATLRVLLAPWQWLTAPRFSGLENVPRDRPALYVANHTLMGMLDTPLLTLGLHDQTGVFVRGLGDHLHFAVPVWRDLLARFGCVEGTRDNCRALMKAGESIIVFPGGGREVFKRKNEKYRLIWKERMGFARLAIEFGYPVIPVAAVGAEDCYEILLDQDDYARLPWWPILERLAERPDAIPPVVRGIGPLPRPQRFYFHFGKVIETKRLQGGQGDDALVFKFRERVRRTLQRDIGALLRSRDRDPERRLATRLRHRIEAGRISLRPAPRKRSLRAG